MRGPGPQPYVRPTNRTLTKARPMSPRSTNPSLVVSLRAALVAALLSYRLVVAAVDPAGNRSTSPPRAFRIVA
jgi:hypothetical protein